MASKSDRHHSSMADFRRHKSACGVGGRVVMWVAARVHGVSVNYRTKEFTYSACSFVEDDGRTCSISDFRVARLARRECKPSPTKYRADIASPLPDSHRCGVSAPFKRAWWFFVHLVDALDIDDVSVEKVTCFQAGVDLLGDPGLFEALQPVKAKVKHVKTLTGKLFRCLLEFSLPASSGDEYMNLPKLVRVEPLERVPEFISCEGSDTEYEDAPGSPTTSAQSSIHDVDALSKGAAELSLSVTQASKGKGLTKKFP